MREHIVKVLNDALYKPLNEKELIQQLNVSTESMGEFLIILDDLEQSGVIYKTRKKKYILPQKAGLIAGTLSRSKKGFGFVIPLTDESGDIYIAAQYLNGAMDGDTVMVFLLSDQIRSVRAGSREGEIKKILKRNKDKFVGIFEGDKQYGFVTDTSGGEDIFITKKNMAKAKNGDKVVVRITAWPEDGKRAEGKIIQILGKSSEPEANMKALIWQYNLQEQFPSKVLAEAERISDEITEKEYKRRIDLRGKTIVTIDGATAKDLDDAVSVELLPSGNYLLGVHIADVSHYVKADTKLDKEAAKRGTSVYFIDQVIPMLPERLSNGVCSLNPYINRLTLSCEMEIDPTGKVVAHRIFESIIETKERLVYTDVSNILENKDENLIKKYGHIYEDLLRMEQLADILRKRRMKNGSVNFEFDEAFITVDQNSVPVDISIAERRVANGLIEEFMLRANETVSEHFFWLDVPFIYRVHDNPDPEKIEALKDFIWNFGYRLKGSSESVHPKALNDILEAAKGKPEEHVVNTLILRSMKKAIYSSSADGHYGLGFQYYSHFTSPIRRYPDLLIHRIIKLILSKKWNDQIATAYQRITTEISESSSKAERNAEKMEREAEKLKMTEYMTYHIGEEYNGIISGAVSAGFFVEIENTIEGFVHLSSLYDDYYNYDREKYKFIGERTGKVYGLGDKVRVKVSAADIQAREITFELL